MVEIAVIADDLTGAADTGVQFCPHFGDIVLTSYQNLSRKDCGHLDPACQGLAVHTDSRSLASESARKRLGEVARRVKGLEPRYLYKKVDSCLRGNLGAEVEAIMDEMGYELSFVAPAFPEMGRTTQHDLHLIDGTPIAQTELSRDPVTPVTDSRLSRVLAAQGCYSVGHVDLRFLDHGNEAVAGEVARWVEAGVRHLVFDARMRAHLVTIAGIALGSRRKILLVGSAGLAEGLAAHLPERPRGEDEDPAFVLEGNHLLVCGTASERTRLQISTLRKRRGYDLISLRPQLLADRALRNVLLSEAHAAQRVLSNNHLIVRIETTERNGREAGPPTRSWPADHIVGGFGYFVQAVLQETRPGSLFLSGGDTADAVLKTVGAQGIRLKGQVIAGVVHGILVGGLADGLPVVTKAGAFGREDVLVALHDYWTKRRGKDPDGR